MPIAGRPHPLQLTRIVLRAVGGTLVAHSVGSFARIAGGIGIVRRSS